MHRVSNFLSTRDLTSYPDNVPTTHQIVAGGQQAGPALPTHPGKEDMEANTWNACDLRHQRQRHLRGAAGVPDVTAHAVFNITGPTVSAVFWQDQFCSGGPTADSSTLPSYLVSHGNRSIVKMKESNQLIQKLLATDIGELHSTAQHLQRRTAGSQASFFAEAGPESGHQGSLRPDFTAP